VNVTLSVDEETLRKAREVARRHGTNLNSMVRRYLRTLAQPSQPVTSAAQILKLIDAGRGDMKGRRWSRDEAHRR